MLSALKILYSLEEPEDNVVAQAANRLGVGEFQVFQLAHADWFGAEAEAKELEPIFFRYLMHDQTDPWVRHYARGIVDLDDRGVLDSDNSHYHRYDARSMRPLSRVSGVLRFVAVVLFVVVFFTVSIVAMNGCSPNPSAACSRPAPGSARQPLSRHRGQPSGNGGIPRYFSIIRSRSSRGPRLTPAGEPIVVAVSWEHNPLDRSAGGQVG